MSGTSFDMIRIDWIEMEAILNKLSTDAQAIYDAGVRAVSGKDLIERAGLTYVHDRPIESFNQVHVIAFGKAAMMMTRSLVSILNRPVSSGIVVVPHGYPENFPDIFNDLVNINVLEAGHPVPDAAGEKAASRILDLAASCGPDDLVIVLISGGGSALLTAPCEGIPLTDVIELNKVLLGCGADIHEMNTVRKHVSRISGGRLAQAVYPACLCSLVLSDVLGDDLTSIASGPTVPDPSMFNDAVSILKQYNAWDKTFDRIRDFLQKGIDHPELETPGSDEPVFKKSETKLIGTLEIALEAAADAARRLGYLVELDPGPVSGEAAAAGRELAQAALNRKPGDQPLCILRGGETTVTLGDSTGKGGRNQELVLAAALEIEGHPHPLVIFSAGTDGIDGPTDAAGSWTTPLTAEQARAIEISPVQCLEEHTSYYVFDCVDQLFKPGPTHTNVMDLQLALIAAPE
jgi:glycerate 2-kinase